MAKLYDNMESTAITGQTDIVCLPCVLTFCESQSEGELRTISSGGLITVDSWDRIKKVRGKCVYWSNVNCSFISHGCYVTMDTSISIPVDYKGYVRVLPKYGQYFIYSSVLDVLNDFPRNLEVLEPVNAFINQDTVVMLKAGDTLETIGYNKPTDSETNIGCLLCKQHGKDDVLQIHTTIKGKFQVLRDDMEYTLKEVLQRFPLPQIIQFSDHLSHDILSTNITEALGKLDKFEGKMRIESSYLETNMIGHYTQPDESKLTEPKVIDSSIFVEFGKTTKERFNGKRESTDPPLQSFHCHSKPVAPVMAFSSESSSISGSTPIPGHIITLENTSKKEELKHINEYHKLTKNVRDKSEYVSHLVEISDREDDEASDYLNVPAEFNIPTKKTDYLTVVMDPPRDPRDARDIQNKLFSELTVEELHDVFKLCNMNSLAEFSQKQSFDGLIFSKISESYLQSQPFHLTSLDLFKLQQIKHGWRPNFNN